MLGQAFGNPAFIVALFLGSIMIITVCFVYLKAHTLAMSGVGMCLLAVMLVGMSVWKTIEVTFNADGITTALNSVEKAVEKTKEQVEKVSSQTLETKEKVNIFEDYVYTINTQKTLRDKGFYNGEVDGAWGPLVQNSVKKFQKEKHLPTTGKLDESTINALQIRPLTDNTLNKDQPLSDPLREFNSSKPDILSDPPDWQKLIDKNSIDKSFKAAPG